MEKQTDTYYYSVYREIIVQIYNGTYKKGDALPSLRELCDIYGVGRNTVRSALLMLQEHGYIELEPRKQAVVSFDMDNPKYQKYYLAEAVGRKTAISQVYDLMEIAMPGVFIYILKALPSQLRKEIAGFVGFFAENLPVKTEAKLQASVMQLYRLVIALPNNRILEQFFFALFSYIQIPISSSEWDKLKLQAIAPLFRTTFKKFQKLLFAQDYDQLEKQMKLFCQTTKKRTERYLDRFSKKIKAGDKGDAYSFTWSITGKSDYIQLASILVYKIGRGECKIGDILPSYAMLAKENDVSEITSRNAIEILAKLELVTTINGVGTKVKGCSQQSRELFLKEMEMREHVVSYFEALQLLIILCRPVLRHAEEMMTEKKKKDLKSHISNQELSRCFDAILPYVGLPAAVPIFDCLKNELSWGYLLNFDIEEDEAGMGRLAEEGSSIAEWIYGRCHNYFDHARKIAREASVEIPIIIW